MDDPSPSPPLQADRPVVAQYCATFLKPEMLHIYRQIIRLREFRPVVFAQKRENAHKFPFGDVILVPKPPTHGLRRIWQRQILGRPVQIYRSEALRLKARLERARATLLHIYFGHIGVQLLPFIELSPIPVIVSFHGADAMVDLEKTAYRKETVRMLEKVGLILVRSESIAQRLYDLGCAREKVRIHRTGIPLDELEFRKRELPADGNWRFLQACRLIEKKGLKTSLRAFAKFQARYPASTFTIAGEGPLKAELAQFASDLGLSDRVDFTGFLSQSALRDHYYHSHAFLHPSEIGPDGNQEGVPNSMLEAMATGLPIFATTHGGIPEAVDNRVSGFLVPESDDAALAAAMLDLASDPARYTAVSQAAAAAVAERFEISAQVKKLEGYYDELTNTRTHRH